VGSHSRVHVHVEDRQVLLGMARIRDAQHEAKHDGYAETFAHGLSGICWAMTIL
jgi:hypothetical protein